MKNNRFTTFLLAFIYAISSIISMTSFPIVSAEESNDTDTYLRVGLRYKEGKVSSENVFAENGFILGYYTNGDVEFTPLFVTEERFISGATDKNFYLSNNKLTTSAGGVKVGAYHIELADLYLADGDDAVAFAKEIEAIVGVKTFAAYNNEAFCLRIGSYFSLDEAKADIERLQPLLEYTLSAVGNYNNTITTVNMNTGDILFEFDFSQNPYTADTYTFAVAPLQVEGKPFVTMKNGSLRYRGAFEFQRTQGGDITFVNVIELQDYIKGVLPYEINVKWPDEVLKAHAITSRCTALYNVKRHSTAGYLLCDTDHCQVYYGSLQEGENANACVDATKNEVVLYNGAVANTVFASSNGGFSESSYLVWGGTPVPYLSAVRDTYEKTANVLNGVWKFEATPKKLAEIFSNANSNFKGTLTDFYVDEYTTTSGAVYSTCAVASNDYVLKYSTCDRVRISLPSLVKSSRFTITKVYDDGTTEISESNKARQVRLNMDWSQEITTTPPVTNVPTDFMIVTSDGNIFDSLNNGYVMTGDGMASLEDGALSILTENGTVSGIKDINGLSVTKSGTTTTPTPTPTVTPTPKTDNSNKTVVKYIFEGKGWGHLVGMSQYGALEMAKAGKTYKEILTHYYKGTTVGKK